MMNDAQREALRKAAQQYLDGCHEDSSVNRSVAAMFASNILALLAESEPTEAAKAPVAAPEVTDPPHCDQCGHAHTKRKGHQRGL